MPENGTPVRRRRHRPRSKSHKEPIVPKPASQDYLRQLEGKLGNAKNARDSYLDYLKKKYPSWNSAYNSNPPPYSSHISSSHVLLPGQIPNYLGNLPPTFENPAPQRRSLISELQTSQYFWNPPETSKANESYYQRHEMLRVNDAIPTSSIYLESDMPNVLSKLQQIQANLKDLREHRLSMPTVEYFRKVAPDLKADLSNLSTSYYGRREKADIPSLAELKARILNLDLHVEKRSREILDEAWNRKRRKSETEKFEKKLFEDNPMPEWLKEKKSAVEELEEEEEKRRRAEESLPMPKVQQEMPLKVAVEEKVPEIVIAPTRKIVFDTPIISQPPVPISTTKPMAPISTPIEPPSPPPQTDATKTSYNRMLELLRPKTFEVSTSSSSSEDELAAGLKAKTPIPPPKPAVTSPPPKAPQTSIFSKPAPPPPPSAPIPKPFSLSAQNPGKEDSDDDFFN